MFAGVINMVVQSAGSGVVGVVVGVSRDGAALLKGVKYVIAVIFFDFLTVLFLFASAPAIGGGRDLA